MNQTSSIKLKIGQREVLRLPGRGTAGYSWGYDLHGDPDVVRVTVEPAPAQELSGKPPGTSADELVKIEGVRSGRTTIHLTQRRSWEKTGKTLDERTLEISVVS